MNVLLYIVISLLLLMCVFLTLLVLIQKGRGGGLASAFGGAGGNTAFGSKTGDVLTWATSIVFGVFLILAVVTNLLADSIHQTRMKSPAGSPPAMPSSNNPLTGSTSSEPLSTIPLPSPTTAPSAPSTQPAK